MKTMNFPSRKNARRIGALARLRASPASEGLGNQLQRILEIKKLSDRIVPFEQAYAVRTKKDRSARGRLSR